MAAGNGIWWQHESSMLQKTTRGPSSSMPLRAIQCPIIPMTQSSDWEVCPTEAWKHVTGGLLVGWMLETVSHRVWKRASLSIFKSRDKRHRYGKKKIWERIPQGPLSFVKSSSQVWSAEWQGYFWKTCPRWTAGTWMLNPRKELGKKYIHPRPGSQSGIRLSKKLHN